MTHRLGVDIGGTFTDFCLLEEASGALHTLKVLSTPDRPGAEVVEGLREIERRYGVAPADITYFTHGTTVGVNTVIQRKGATLCLITTEAFEDVLEVARLKMPDPYDLFSHRPAPLVPRERVFSVHERILADGSEAAPVDEESVLRALAGVRDAGGEAVVVALLHAYRNPAHERAVRDLLVREAPDIVVTLSSDVWPVIREYERTTTAVVAGYVQPRVSHYIAALEDSLAAAGVGGVPMVTKSNGGVMAAALGKRECAQMLLSGTASGVIGASHVAAMTAAPGTMSLDIGGTSADVAFIRDGEPQYGVGELIGDFPVYIPTVSVTSIGEGGGSIAWVDNLGVLKVGPESAGSVPGPACYGRGGERATITDAFVVCGLLGAADLGYDAVRIDAARAREVVAEIGTAIGLEPEAAAEAIIQVAVSGMYLEVSKLLSNNGIDPRDLTLQAFGGAGPMLAGFLARELGMRRMVVPRTPGVLSAFGGLIADIKNDFIQTVFLDAEETSVEPLREVFRGLREQAERWLREAQGFDGEAVLVHSADMRYRGQSFEIETTLDAEWIASGDVAAMRRAFHAEHARVYDHADEDAAVQLINLRLVIAGISPKPAFAPLAAAAGPPEPAGRLRVFYDDAHRDATLYRRDDLLAGHRLSGPAVIGQADCTTCVLHGWDAEVDDHGNLIIEATHG